MPLERVALFWWLLICASFFSLSSLSSQTAGGPYVVGSVSYTLQRTKSTAFERYFGNMQGKTFASYAELEDYLDELRQRMIRSSMFRSFDIKIGAPVLQNGEQVVNILVDLKDSWPAIGMVVPLYSTSMGFVLAGGGIFPNVSGYLFDILTNATYNAEPRHGELAWSDPTYQAGIAFAKIPLGSNLFLGLATDVIRNVKTIQDRGVEVLIHRSIQLDNRLSLLWEPNRYWSLLNTVQHIEGYLPEISYATNNKNYGAPRKRYFLQKAVVTYDQTLREEDGMPIGVYTQMMIGYSFGQSFFFEEPDHAFHYSASVDYTWNIANIFFPRVAAKTFYKTGLPEYDLGREMRGIIDGEWSGNGVSRLSVDFLFHIYELPGWFFLHLGPYVDYGVSYGTSQEFLETDQGWAIGLRLRFLASLAPSAPLFLDLGYDLRDKYAWNDVKRFEVTIGTSFSI